MLRIDRLTKSFGGRLVLDALDVAIEPGESVALLGANGSGKTTTLRCVVGLARPDAGAIRIAGVDARRDPIGARRRCSYLPQKAAFPQTLTVRETLDVVARLRELAPSAVDRELAACDLAALANRGVAGLSGGERQRLAMAVAFLPDVPLYLFDEPSASLDPASSRILFQRSRQLIREGRTLLFSTHIPADVRGLASRAVLLGHGRIQAEARGEFELRRCERMLERELWGEDHEELRPGDRADECVAVDRRLRRERTGGGTGAA
ncbi:MAG: ABC transporter ATP-binding protein [Acidobacteria bacterium]|nr:ABC transporter ATP-binding protein [Acidobacteriota bacterium]